METIGKVALIGVAVCLIALAWLLGKDGGMIMLIVAMAIVLIGLAREARK